MKGATASQHDETPTTMSTIKEKNTKREAESKWKDATALQHDETPNKLNTNRHGERCHSLTAR